MSSLESGAARASWRRLSRGRPSARRRAFTIVELLVVVAVLTLLVSIMVPSMSVARELTKSAVCGSKQNQITKGVLMYASMNQGYLVPGSRGTSKGQWGATLVETGFVTAPTSPKAEAFADRDSVFRCPSGAKSINPDDTGDNEPKSHDDWRGAYATTHRLLSTTAFVHVWYGINGDESTTKWPFTKWTTMPTSVLHKLSWIRRPGDTVAFFDGWSMLNNTPARINARHLMGKRTNVSFFDGSSKPFDVASLPKLDDPDTYPAFAGRGQSE